MMKLAAINGVGAMIVAMILRSGRPGVRRKDETKRLGNALNHERGDVSWVLAAPQPAAPSEYLREAGESSGAQQPP